MIKNTYLASLYAALITVAILAAIVYLGGVLCGNQ